MIEGTHVGAYRLLKPIGEGGMGSVWLAEHIALGRRAAMKMLHPELSSRSDIVTRFFNEARAATSIADPGIVQIFDFGQHVDGSAYIVMELLDGEPLDRRLKREGALSLADGLRLMRQVASTLGAAHACGIVHRDLKPENIFIVRDPEVPGDERAKVLDFGIAKLAGDHAGVKTQTTAMMGTPMFMSPEQCRGAGQVDQRSDVYALGCVLFTLVVGRPPFNTDGIGDIIVMHLREPSPSPSQLRPGLPPELDQLVLRCLAKDPAQRFPTAGELAMAIGGLVGSAPQVSAARTSGYVSVTGPTTLSGAAGASGALPARQSRVGVSAVFAGAGVAGVVVAIVVVRGEPSADRAIAHIAQGRAARGVRGCASAAGDGLGFELWAESRYDAAKAEMKAEMMNQPRRDSLYSAANTRRYVGEALAVGGLAAGGAAVWLYLRDGWREWPAPAEASVHVVPAVTGLALTGRF